MRGTRRARRLGIALASLLLGGCGGAPPVATTPLPEPAAPVVAEEPALAPPPRPTPAPEPPALDKALVRAAVDAWVAAQVALDFEAYQGLYADDFAGVLRVGKKATPMDRSAWLESRAKMFKTKFELSVDDVVIVSKAELAEVMLTQEFQTRSGKFKDIGPKRLVLAPRGDALKIIAEEMLESRLVSYTKVLGAGDLAAMQLPASLITAVRTARQDRTLRPVWARPLAPASVALLFRSEDELVAAVADAGDFTLRKTASVRAGHLPHLSELAAHDVDGDGHDDHFIYVRSGWYHESWEELLAFTSGAASAASLTVGGGWSESSASDEGPIYACFTRVDGIPALFTSQMSTSEWFDADKVRSKSTFGARLFLLKEGAFAPSPVFAYEVETANTLELITKRWEALVGDRLARGAVNRKPGVTNAPPCFGGATPLFIAGNGRSKPPLVLVRGLALTREAAAAGAPAGARVVELEPPADPSR